MLVEADPDFYSQLIGKNRGSAATMNSCLSPKRHPIKGHFLESGRMLGKLSSSSGDENSMEVYCFPLYSILLAMGNTHLYFFSLDVEGQELYVLKTIPWDKVDISTLTVEYRHIPNGGKEALQAYMEEQGYFIHTDVAEVAPGGLYREYIFVKNAFKKSSRFTLT